MNSELETDALHRGNFDQIDTWKRRALAAEADAAAMRANAKREAQRALAAEASDKANVAFKAIAIRERDEARAEVARLREALERVKTCPLGCATCLTIINEALAAKP